MDYSLSCLLFTSTLECKLLRAESLLFLTVALVSGKPRTHWMLNKHMSEEVHKGMNAVALMTILNKLLSKFSAMYVLSANWSPEQINKDLDQIKQSNQTQSTPKFHSTETLILIERFRSVFLVYSVNNFFCLNGCFHGHN